jgi:hypothetical protein
VLLSGNVLTGHGAQLSISFKEEEAKAKMNLFGCMGRTEYIWAGL